jgi:leucyl aminopeptidase
MNFSLSADPIFTRRAPVAILFLFENERPTGPAPLHALLKPVSPKEFRGAPKQLLLLHTAGKLTPDRLLLAGLGKRANFTPETLRQATGLVVNKLRATGLDRATVAVPDPTAAATVTDAALLADYRFTEFKPADDDATPLRDLTLCLPLASQLPAAKTAVQRAQIIAESANYARALGDLPGNVIYPAALADHAKTLARQTGLRCTVLDKPALVRGNFGGLLAVGGGSARDPRLIILEHVGKHVGAPFRARPGASRPEGRSHDDRPIVLVGKAITFDSGGISIKPSDKMDEMKFDKCGGCATLGLLRAAALLRLPLNITGLIAAAENMPSATSYRPGDIITSYRGNDPRAVTVEVLNTDAEGRIVLGDALVYARQLGARAIIDFATLTGACVVALGEYAAGLMGNDEKLQEKIRAAADRTGERVWPLPLWQEYKDKIKSDVADIKNTGGRYGGAITAAAFLAKYVGDTPWAHLDIAGTAWATENRPYLAKGATGFGVRLIADMLNDWK